MRNKFLQILSLFLIMSIAFAGPITPQRALNIASKFLNSDVYSRAVGNNKLSISYVANNEESQVIPNISGTHSNNLYYVINRGENNGFIVVSGDDVVSPILAYSEKGRLNPQDIKMHPSISWLFSEYERQLKYALKNTPSSIAGRFTDNGILQMRNMSIVVKPLFRYHRDRRTLREHYISFGQDWPFNDLCPNMTFKDKNGRKRTMPTVSGCVATGISMVMRWHEWPLDPVGKVSYYWNNKYLMKLDFDNVDTKGYDWNVMPEAIDSYGRNRNTRRKCSEEEADQVARLLRDVGYSVKMNYGIAQQGGSGTQVYYAPPVLMKNFGYAEGCKWIKRSDYSKPQWINQITDELKNYGPIIYAGFSTGGGHCFCIDGYSTDGNYNNTNQPNDYVHVNWGWNTMEDGWYKLDILKPGEEGIGGGAGGYKSGQQMIRFLKPNRKETPKPSPEPTPEPTPEDNFDLHVEQTSQVAKFDKNDDKQRYTVTVRNDGNKSFYSRKIYLIIAANKTGRIIGSEYAYVGYGTKKEITFYNLDFSKIDKGNYQLYIALKNEDKNKIYAIDKPIANCQVFDENDREEPIVPQKIGPILKLINDNSVSNGTAEEGSKYRTKVVLNNVGDEEFSGNLKVYLRPFNAVNRSRDQLVASGTSKLKVSQQLNLNISANLKNIKPAEYQLLITYTQENGDETYIKDEQGYDAVIGNLEVLSKSKPLPPTPQKIVRVYQGDAYFYQEGKYKGNNSAIIKYYRKEFRVKTYINVSGGPFTGQIKVFITGDKDGVVPVRPYGTVDYKEKIYNVKDFDGTHHYANITFTTKGMYHSTYYVRVMYRPSTSSKWLIMPNDRKAFSVDYSSYYEYKGDYSDKPTKDPKVYEFEEPAFTSIGVESDDTPERNNGKNMSELEETSTSSATIYPTMVIDNIHIVSNESSKVEVFDATGAKVKAFDVKNGDTEVSVENLKAGVYIIRFSGNSFKFIKK